MNAPISTAGIISSIVIRGAFGREAGAASYGRAAPGPSTLALALAQALASAVAAAPGKIEMASL